MVAVSLFEVCTGRSHLVTVPVPDTQRSEVEKLAELLHSGGHSSDEAYMVVDLPNNAQ